MAVTETKKINTIGVLTSGGDSPGMNTAIRAVVRTAIGSDLKVVGIEKGFQGLLEGKLAPMDITSVSNIIQRGGTILKTSRCKEFHNADVRKEAYNILKRNNIDGLIIIGGNGSFQGAMALSQEHGLPVIGVPGTIDNDISGTDYTIGFDTAIQTATEAIDKIRDTAASHQRTFIIEVMGRHSPAIALQVGIATGAEYIVFPEHDGKYEEMISIIKAGQARGKTSSLIIVAEGEKAGNAQETRRVLEVEHNIPCHLCTLGHTQRGGSPSARDRFIASQMGFHAVNALTSGNFPVATSFVQGSVTTVPLSECLGRRDGYAKPFTDLIRALAI